MQTDNGPVLDARSLRRSFGSMAAVHDLDLCVQRGELVAVVGPPGGGKSTLFGLLSGHLDCDEGRILFKGEDVTELSSLRRA